MALKYKKKLITTTTEQFNTKPSKGVAYMQEMGLIKTPMDPVEVANFMRTNPHLEKKQMGEYISRRDNLHILEAFVQSFDFAGLRVDESLRIFLEGFR
jgi:brefeldin A-resistance guanine nucleotide exchange factor 1